MFFCCHVSQWEMFCWFCIARLLYLRLDHGWAIVHPSRKQSQPPPCLAVLSVNRIAAIAVPSPPQWFPISNHCHVSPTSFGKCAGNLVCHRSEKPLGHFWRHFFETAKIQTFWANFEKMLFWTSKQNLVSFAFFGGCGLPNSEAFCSNSAEAGATRRFLSRKVHVLASETHAHLGTKSYVNILGLLRQFRGRFSKVKIHLPKVRIAFLSVLSTHPRSCRPFPL